MISYLPLLVALFFHEISMLGPMATAPVAFTLIGLLLMRIKKAEIEIPLSVALGSVALIWLVSSLVGALPFVFGLGMPYTSSVFEAMSGWTSTGLSLMPSVDDAPRTLLFWRSLTQWLGGIGIVALTTAVASHSSLTHFRLYRSEGRSEAFMPSVVATAMAMWRIYVLLTLLGVGLILLSGVPLWDAVNIAMTAIATGGFSVHSAGIMYYRNPLLEVLIIPIMIAGALPFKVYYLMYHRKRLGLFGDAQAHLLIALILFGSMVAMYDLIVLTSTATMDALRQSLFTITSAATCTGFNNADPFLWPSVTVLFISLFMLIGGSSGSTAGGIKLSRVILSYEMLIWWFRRLYSSPRAHRALRHEGKPIEHRIAEYEISKNALIVVIFVLAVFVATLVVLHFDPSGTLSSSDVLFDVISAMSNVGLSTGYVNPGMSTASQWMFIFLMWFGRLEVIPVMVVVVGLYRAITG
ncbi:MAG: TrkH family potassium uptake protein [Methanomicrobiaceae archaeon]|nr:TrkH family potassium uptake protein [Methanomicrobiaceae archaeon]